MQWQPVGRRTEGDIVFLLIYGPPAAVGARIGIMCSVGMDLRRGLDCLLPQRRGPASVSRESRVPTCWDVSMVSASNG